MRPIAPDETCFSAEEIVARFKQATGISLHPTNAGNAAKQLDLDYIEGPEEYPQDGGARRKPRRRYGELDLPRIFENLHALTDRRRRYRA